jgi:hypothetical protein
MRLFVTPLTMNKKLVMISAVFLMLVAARATEVDRESLQNPVLKPFYSELQSLFRKYYPDATSHLLRDKIHFEHDTRLFIVHEPWMTGEWQDPWEERGPKRGGILCDITLQQGKYQGQATVPQTFDKRYFKVLLLVGYSAKQDAHVHVLLSYPANVRDDFLKEFTGLVNNFPKYVETPTERKP